MPQTNRADLLKRIEALGDQASGPVKALAREAEADWNGSHELVQDDPSREAAWVHAYLHRKEGDSGNAAYWYAKAGRPKSQSTLDEEWIEIVLTFLAHTK